MESKIKEQKNDTLSILPPIKGRYIVFDTETTGLEPKENNIIEIAAIEIYNGKLTGREFHSFMTPRFPITKSAEEKHKMSQNFYQNYYHDVYRSDKQNFESFLKFLGNSLIFAHNAIFDMKFLNRDLKYWDLNPIPRKRFRCSMRLFKLIVKPDTQKQKYALDYCCNFFNLTAPIDNFHSAIFDAFMTARMICSLFQYNNNLKLNNQINSVSNGLIGNEININNNNKENHNNELNNLVSPYKTLSVVSRSVSEVTKVSNENDLFKIGQQIINNKSDNLNKDDEKIKEKEYIKIINGENKSKLKNDDNEKDKNNYDEDEPITINENELDLLL
jgi:DNA polymerase-3 subunit epsilon